MPITDIRRTTELEAHELKKHKVDRPLRRKPFTASEYGETWNKIYPILERDGEVALDVSKDLGYNLEEDNIRKGLLTIARSLRAEGLVNFRIGSRTIRYPREEDDNPEQNKCTLLFFKVQE